MENSILYRVVNLSNWWIILFSWLLSPWLLFIIMVFIFSSIGSQASWNHVDNLILRKFFWEPEAPKWHAQLASLEVGVNESSSVLGGMMSFSVKSKTNDTVKCEVIDGGELKSRRHLNVRGKSATLPSITGVFDIYVVPLFIWSLALQFSSFIFPRF